MTKRQEKQPNNDKKTWIYDINSAKIDPEQLIIRRKQIYRASIYHKY